MLLQCVACILFQVNLSLFFMQLSSKCDLLALQANPFPSWHASALPGCFHFVWPSLLCFHVLHQSHPVVLPPPALPSTTPTPQLDHFIAYTLHQMQLHQSVTFAALYLLQCLKAQFPAAKGSSGHQLFISAFMLSSKIICNNTYSNKSWCIVGQGMFALQEINQMEWEMCSYLEWQLNIDPSSVPKLEAPSWCLNDNQ